MDAASNNMKTPGALITVGVEGSFGTLYYAVLALTADPRTPGAARAPWLAEELIGRGFRPARTADVEDIVLKAQPADGSIHCRVSEDGLISVLVDDNPVWSGQVDLQDREAAGWIKAARSKEVTVISGDLVRSGRSDDAGTWKPEVMARISTAWVP